MAAKQFKSFWKADDQAVRLAELTAHSNEAVKDTHCDAMSARWGQCWDK